jgi:hypothetical protein
LLPPDLAQEVIERGINAAAVLESEHFMAVLDQQTTYHISAIVAAPPGPRGADAIQYHHAIQHALSELVAILKAQVDAGAAMERALAEAAEEHEDEDLNDA